MAYNIVSHRVTQKCTEKFGEKLNALVVYLPGSILPLKRQTSKSF